MKQISMKSPFEDRGLLAKILWVCKQNKCSLKDIYELGDSVGSYIGVDHALWGHILACREEYRRTCRYIRVTPTYAAMTHPED